MNFNVEATFFLNKRPVSNVYFGVSHGRYYLKQFPNKYSDKEIERFGGGFEI